MSQELLKTLQKYNIKSVQKSLSDHLCQPQRFENFSAKTGDLLLDFSRTGLDQQSLAQLLELAEKSGVAEAPKTPFWW